MTANESAAAGELVDEDWRVRPGLGEVSEGEERIFVATQRQLMWWRFRKHRLAIVGAVVAVMFYVSAVFADFVAYADPLASNGGRSLLPPQEIHWFDNGSFAPYVNPVVGKLDLVTFQKVYKVDENVKVHIVLFAHGYSYQLFGFIPTDIHLIGTEGDPTASALSLLGTDTQGRDQFSRLAIATRTSLSIGLAGVALSLFLGVLLGGVSGYMGGAIDSGIQRVNEVVRSLPTIPLWMGLAAAMPRDWSVLQVYIAMTLILALVGWAELARVVRGKFLALRQEDFVTAAELSGASSMRVIRVHLVPLVSSHIIAAATLALPLMIVSETSLSFLGLGLRPPAISWGVMLQQAQNIQTIAFTPWLLFPAVPVILAILAFNFLGDGLRDAADPYGT